MRILIFLFVCIGQLLASSDETLELETIQEHQEKDFIDLNQQKGFSLNTSPKKFSRPFGTFNLPLKEGHLFLEGEYLYWKPYAFIPYAVKNTTVGSFSTNYKNPQVNLKAHFGFRGTLGIYLPEPTWYLTGAYTQLISEGSDFLSTEGQARASEIRLSYIWAAVSPVSEANTGPGQASATEKLFYRNVDVHLNRAFICSSRFSLDTFFGVKYSKIKINMDILYSEQEASSGQFGKVQVDLHNNFNAVGINAGLKGNWQLGGGFEVFGKSSFSSLYGKFLIKDKQHIFRPSDGDLSPIITNSNKFDDMYTHAQLGLGLIWGGFFNNKNVYLGFKAGYELNVWPGLIRIQEIPNILTSLRRIVPFKNFLSMQGLTTSIKMDF